jgi:hypothetical protein
MLKIDYQVTYKGEAFANADRLGFDDEVFVISLNHSGGGSLFTTIPISPKEYRQEHPTKTGYKVSHDRGIYIYDDYGSPTFLNIKNSDVEALKAELHSQNIPQIEWD